MIRIIMIINMCMYTHTYNLVVANQVGQPLGDLLLPDPPHVIHDSSLDYITAYS